MKTLTDNLQTTKAEYRIRFTFSDETVNEVNFYPFLSRPHQSPMVTQFLDKNKFQQFEITQHNDISWDDYEMCFPPETLYSGEF